MLSTLLRSPIAASMPVLSLANATKNEDPQGHSSH
jgi:hypothetical protein